MKTPTILPHAALAVGAALLLLIPSTHAAPPALPDGTIPSNMAVQLKRDDMNPATLDQVRDLGFKWVRRGFIWEGIETQKGAYDFAQYDYFVKNCKARGLGIIAPLAFSNKLYGHVKDEPARSAYAAWAAAAVERYKDENILWEIWNEPNTKTFWGKHGKVGNSPEYAKEYTDLVKAAIPAMRKADPECIILAGSVSNMWTESYKWMGYCFNNEGMLKLDWDAWSVHPYGVKAPEDYIEAYAITRKLMDDAGGSKKPWINSERGFPVKKEAEGFAGGEAAKTYEYQAWHLVRQYLIDLLEGVNLTSWYEWSGNEGFALYKENNQPPAYLACQVFVAQLSGYKLDKRLETEKPRDFVLRFTNPQGGVKLVAWTSPPAPMATVDTIVDHPVTVPVEAGGSLKTVDLYGKESRLTVSGGKIEVPLTGAPQYITVK